MSNLQTHLFAALRSALWNTPLTLTLSEQEARDLLTEARQQAIDGLICGALTDQNVPLPKMEIAHCLEMLRVTAHTNRLINTEMTRFTAFMERKGMVLAVVKGQSVATCYPHPERRTPGDVDFLARADCFEPMKAIVEAQTGEPIKDVGGKHVEFTGEEVEYEMHRYLVDFYVGRHQKYYDALCAADLAAPLKRVTIGEKDIPTLPATNNALFVFLHMFWHFIRGGVGLRQLIDNAMLLHAWREEIDVEALKKHLSALGMENAYRAFGHIYIKYIGLPKEEFPYVLSARDERRGERVFRAVLRFGNFGRKIDHLIKKANAAHTVQTAWGVLSQAMKYFTLAPSEMAAVFPMQTVEKAQHIYKVLTKKI